jgi:regulator of sirC expression with transglutaminase-like and TPR domain
LDHGEQKVDLLAASLLIAKLDEQELDTDAYVADVERMADEIRRSLPPDADEQTRLNAMNHYLFEQNGYHGNRFDYYHRANSYMNRVIDDRTGLPITLSVLYIELGRRLELAIEGIGLPGHFIVRFRPSHGDPQWVDAFDHGRNLTQQEVVKIVTDNTQSDFDSRFLEPASDRDILLRMLRNLQSIAQGERDLEAMLRYLEAMLAIDPTSIESRGMRAVVRFQSGRRQSAIADLDWFLEHKPAGADLQRIQEMRDYFQHRGAAAGKTE